MKVFIRAEKLTEEKGLINFIHYKPDLLQDTKDGYIIDNYVEPEKEDGKIAKQYYLYKENKIVVEYIEATKTEKEDNAEQIEKIGSSLTEEKLKNIQLNTTVNSLGQELAKVKLQLTQVLNNTESEVK